jgi:hypothetical protein
MAINWNWFGHTVWQAACWAFWEQDNAEMVANCRAAFLAAIAKEKA